MLNVLIKRQNNNNKNVFLNLLNSFSTVPLMISMFQKKQKFNRYKKTIILSRRFFSISVEKNISNEIFLKKLKNYIDDFDSILNLNLDKETIDLINIYKIDERLKLKSIFNNLLKICQKYFCEKSISCIKLYITIFINSQYPDQLIDCFIKLRILQNNYGKKCSIALTGSDIYLIIQHILTLCIDFAVYNKVLNFKQAEDILEIIENNEEFKTHICFPMEIEKSITLKSSLFSNDNSKSTIIAEIGDSYKAKAESYFLKNYLITLYKIFKNPKGELLLPIIENKNSVKEFLLFVKSRETILYIIFKELVVTYLSEFTYFSDALNIEEYSLNHIKSLKMVGKAVAHDLILLFLKWNKPNLDFDQVLNHNFKLDKIINIDEFQYLLKIVFGKDLPLLPNSYDDDYISDYIYYVLGFNVVSRFEKDLFYRRVEKKKVSNRLITVSIYTFINSNNQNKVRLGDLSKSIAFPIHSFARTKWTVAKNKPNSINTLKIPSDFNVETFTRANISKKVLILVQDLFKMENIKDFLIELIVKENYENHKLKQFLLFLTHLSFINELLTDSTKEVEILSISMPVVFDYRGRVYSKSISSIHSEVLSRVLFTAGSFKMNNSYLLLYEAQLASLYGCSRLENSTLRSHSEWYQNKLKSIVFSKYDSNRYLDLKALLYAIKHELMDKTSTISLKVDATCSGAQYISVITGDVKLAVSSNVIQNPQLPQFNLEGNNILDVITSDTYEIFRQACIDTASKNINTKVKLDTKYYIKTFTYSSIEQKRKSGIAYNLIKKFINNFDSKELIENNDQLQTKLINIKIMSAINTIWGNFEFNNAKELIIWLFNQLDINKEERKSFKTIAKLLASELVKDNKVFPRKIVKKILIAAQYGEQTSSRKLQLISFFENETNPWEIPLKGFDIELINFKLLRKDILKLIVEEINTIIEQTLKTCYPGLYKILEICNVIAMKYPKKEGISLRLPDGFNITMRPVKTSIKKVFSHTNYMRTKRYTININVIKRDNQDLPILNRIKLSSSLCANLIHTCDALTMRRTIIRMHELCLKEKRNIKLVSLHDCVIITPDLLNLLLEIYNEELIQTGIWANNTINSLLKECGPDIFNKWKLDSHLDITKFKKGLTLFV